MSTSRSIGYSTASILIHWLGVVAVVVMFVTGQMFDDVPRGDARTALIARHVGIGALLALFLAARVIWRLAARDGGTAIPQRGPLDWLALAVKVALLAAIAALIITGPLSIWMEGKPIVAITGLELTSPFAPNRALHDLLKEVHEIAANALIPLVALHVLGALKHAVIDRDGTLMRILAPGRDR